MKPQKQTVQGPVLDSLVDGQPYVDQPTYTEIPVYCGIEPMNGKVVRYHTRIPIRWMKRTADGKVVPR